VLSIQDNGVGFDLDTVDADKLGLIFMRERAEQINADLKLESASNQGTLVILSWRPDS
jgi:nitrate/nitrite-specific signal transduction histidine kinase